MSERTGAVTGAPVADYVAVLCSRALRTPPKASLELSRWGGYSHLGRQDWDPAHRDQRGVRRFAALCSGLLHLVFAVMLLWLGIVAIGDAPPEAQQAGEAVQIEYIGVGTPTDVGGAPAPGETDAPASAGAAAQPQPAATAAASAPSPPVTPENASDEPPQPAEAVSAQTLVVTETAKPDIDFTLPPPKPRDLTLPQLQVVTPDIAAQTTEVETFEPRPSVRVLERPPLQIRAPTVPILRTEVTEVEMQRPLQPVQARALSQNALPTPTLQVPATRTQPGEVAVRVRPAATQSTSTLPAATSGNGAAAGRAPAAVSAPTSGGRPQAQGSGRPTGVAPAGAGAAPSPRSGAVPSTTRSDDWGDSTRNRPGNSSLPGNSPGNSTAGRGPGLFNGDGSARLPGDGSRAGGGLPPGTITEDFEKIDRMGTWLKRPPLDYTPTRFDRFWAPNRTLLEEWVSRGIKKVAIPIPGTTKRIECTVSLLMAGGGCTIYDPNLQDQEAIARPPPDVPFKPELQQDKGSLQRPPL